MLSWNYGSGQNPDQEYARLFLSNGRIGYSESDDTDFVLLNAQGIQINDGNWHHLALVRDGNTATTYIDGEMNSTSTAFTTTPSVNTITIGRWFIDFQNFFDGSFDDMRLWNDVRTQSELQDNMFCPISNYTSDLVLYLPFEEGIPNGDNTAVNTAADPSNLSTYASLIDLAKTGTSSNFVTGVEILRYIDADEDGYGSVATLEFCPDDPVSFLGGDCDDSDPNVNFYMDEICDNDIDDNCDGVIDGETNRGLDFDGVNDFSDY